MLALTLSVGPFVFTIALGRAPEPAEDPGDYADVTSADLTRSVPVGFCAPDPYPEEDRHG